MKRQTQTFIPSVHFGEADAVNGEITAYGLVMHRSLAVSLDKWGYYDVSDPATGMLVCYGLFPGRLGAVCALVQLAASHRGKIRERLQQAREGILKNNVT